MNNLLLKSYLRCKRKAWLDYKGNKLYKSWSPQKSIEQITEYKNFKAYTGGDLYTGIKACELGYKGVIGLIIKYELKENCNTILRPSMLVKTIGKSKWGNYKYVPAVSRLGQRTTREHLLDLALCAIFLEKIQKSRVEYGLVLSSYGNKLGADKISLNTKLRKKAISSFLELNDTLRGNIPNITKNRKKCSICTWQKFCDKEASSFGYLTEIDGIGSKTALNLKKIGIKNINQLAKIDKFELNDKLSKIQAQDIKKSSRFIHQSKSYISGIPLSISKWDEISKQTFLNESGYFVLDIESNPDEKHDFLYGFIGINNIYNNDEEYQYDSILNLNQNNKKCFDEIYSKLQFHKNWPILHYGDTEKIAITKLAKQFELNNKEINDLSKRFIDLHCVIRNTWILPIKNYSLKTVANWIGFDWKQKNVSGSRALYWWIQYQDTQDKIFIEKIMQYNKDDCLATLSIAKWLLEKISN